MLRRARRGLVPALALALWSSFTAAQSAPNARCAEGCPPCAVSVAPPRVQSPEREAAQRREGGLLLAAVEGERLRASQRLGEARRARDIIRVQCVVDRLARIDSIVLMARDGHEALVDAIESRDHDRREHSLRLLRIYSQRAAVFGVETARCTPQPAVVRNETVVTVRVPAGVADFED
jgi:hypothetical protein